MYNNTYPQPIGNIMNVGGYGYNTGYYNNMNTGYFNPYLYHKQQQALEAQQREIQRQQSDLMKILSIGANKVTGHISNMESHLQKYDIDYRNNSFTEINEYNKFLNMHNNSNIYNDNVPNYYVMHSNNISAQNKERFPDDMNVYDYLAKAGEILQEIKIEEAMKRNRDVSQLYDRNSYLNLIKLHQGNIPRYNSVFGNKFNPNTVNIDDMEIALPDSLSNEYYAKKKAFLENIFK